MDIQGFLDRYRKGIRELKERSPKSVEPFLSFYNQVMQDGALSLKVKELIALAVGVAIHCEHCVIIHTHGAQKAKATPEEILEAAQVGVVMGGGPAFTFLPLVQEVLPHS
ncbi:MAG: carboxymuconolactone decarboxylase family protein [Candidatus Caldatribacteriaceae bacterium]